MTCKDCIHYDVCQDLRYGDITDCDSKDCGGFFQNKADFVEVVKCEKCKHDIHNGGDCDRVLIHTKRNLVLEQNEYLYYKLNYCEYGERKND